jgi:hypothetical protein
MLMCTLHVNVVNINPTTSPLFRLTKYEMLYRLLFLINVVMFTVLTQVPGFLWLLMRVSLFY